MIRYLNTKLNGKTETIDHLDSDNYSSHKEFRKAMTYLMNEYLLAGGFGRMYWSQKRL